MAMINAYDAAAATSLPDRDRALINRRERLLGPAYRLFYANPVHIVRGDGVWLYDPDGNGYLDVYNNVACVGHCHPHVVAALSKQSSVLNTHTRYLTDGVLDYAERLISYFPPELSHVMFTCTGSEANDLAYQVASAFTGGTGVIITQLAYHGNTLAISKMSPSLGDAMKLGQNVRTVPAPDSYRSANKNVGETLAANVREAIADMEENGIKPAALLVDSIFSSDGIYPDPAGFLAPAVTEIRKAGGVFIADEVQPGFGRTGSGMWGFSRHNVLPDIVTMGKPMGNGHPIAGMVVKPEILDAFGKKSRYFNTFGGNSVSCAAGMAVLDVIQRGALVANADTVGSYLRNGLQTLAKRHELVGDVRGAGLFVGVELVADRATRRPATAETLRLVNGLREKRVLISACGPFANVLKIRPPLVFKREHADLFLAAMDEVLSQIEAGR
jgi:4-aminobutyrate aminotransferase-like enzyme